MNLSVPLGLVLGVAVILIASSAGIENRAIFLNWHAALIVGGGTAAAALICFPLSYFLNLFKVLFQTISGRRKAETLRTIQEIVKLSEAVNNGSSMENETGAVKNPFLKEAIQLVEQGGLSENELEDVLEKRVEFQNEKYKRDSMTFKIIGKFPPAFGLVGTSMGMISLLQGMGQPNAFEQLGHSMSLSLVATFYGLVLANLLLIPVGENLTQASEEDLVMRRIVVDGVRLLKAQKHPLLVEEYLNSYLSPKDRVKAKA